MMKGSKGEQLQMLMPAKDLQSRIPESNDRFDDVEDMQGLWQRKLSEASLPAGTAYPDPDPDHSGSYGEYTSTSYDGTLTHGTGIVDSLSSRGWDGHALQVRHMGPPGADSGKNLFINDGHHRLAAASHLGMEVPVTHRDSKSTTVEYAGRNRGSQFDVRLASHRDSDERKLSASKQLLQERLKGGSI
jgi:hypothetical protein